MLSWVPRMPYGRVALSILYLAASTNLVALTLDSVAPRTKVIASPDFPCASHDCGCRTAKQCRLRCCCHPKMPQQREGALCHLQHTKPLTVHVSHWSEARCRGHHHGDPRSPQKLDAHLPLPNPSRVACAISWKPLVSRGTAPHRVFLDPPDKVPI